MKNTDFLDFIAATPRYVPMFKLVRVAEWVADHGFVKGDLFYFSETRGFVDVKSDGSFDIGPSSFKFIEYKKV